jgi:tRNA pseudouridine13 synthase
VVIVNVPEIDKMVGIKFYCTSSPGTGGLIKQNPEDFKVFEILHDSVLRDYCHLKNDKYKFPLYSLQKTGLDSNHALIEIKGVLGLNLRCLGIKDSKAVSTQYCTTDQRLTIKTGNTPHTKLSLIGFTKEPLRKSHLVGNQFQIVISNMKHCNSLNFTNETSFIPNFYGLQRFGSARLVTHLVGRQILKKDFSDAVHTLLCHTTCYDTKLSKEIRDKCEDPANYTSVLKSMPSGMDIERNILISLINGKDSISCLRSIPINIRRLFVHAYQAFVFNECISSLIMEGEEVTKCVDKDLCFELENAQILGKLRKFSTGMNIENKVPATQLAGYGLRDREGRFEKTMLKIISDEGLSIKNFFVKEMQELSVQGGFRQLPLMVSDFNYDDKNIIKFRLPVGAYATTLLRELMKPSNPVEAGF